MRDRIVPQLHKWPFLLGDALMLGLAFFLYQQSSLPLGRWEMFACVFCVAVGAGLGILPYLGEYRAAVRLAEAGNLASTVAQIKKLEQLAAQISEATAQWQTVQASASKTAQTAQEIAVGMASEAKGFHEFLQRANDTERAALRLEVDKARRAEAEWLQVVVRTLDHVYALHQAALRSGQSGLIEQLGAFQNACREASRRVGVTPYVAGSGEVFDQQRHQLVEGEPQPSPGALVVETVATGYTFQGRLVRPALVRLRNGNPITPANAAQEKLEAQTTTAAALAQDQLPLER